MLPIISQDITLITKGVILHQVNIEGIMGAGLARQIAKKWPEVELAYKKYCDDFTNILGDCLVVHAAPNIYVANIFGQSLTVKHPNIIPTNYNAVETALRSFTTKPTIKGRQVYVPYLMGCALGGGDWYIYSYLIEKYIPDAIVCVRPN
jgi:O-acetyl-ADP-ribose deacetylase (regulator of RNase III)